MLSVQECKKYIKNEYSQEQIQEIRQGLYQLADLFIDEYLKKKKISSKGCYESNNLLQSFNKGTG